MTVNRCRLLCAVCKLIFIYRVEYQHDCQACFLEVSDSASRRRCQANTCLNKRASCVSPLTSELTMRSLSHCNSLGLQDGFNAPTNIMLFAQQQWQYGIQDALCKQCAEQYGTSMRRAVWHFNGARMCLVSHAVAKCASELTTTWHACMEIFHIWDLMGLSESITTNIGWRHGLLQICTLMGWTIQAVSRFLPPSLIQRCQW